MSVSDQSTASHGRPLVLDGLMVTRRGRSVAADVALRQLRALGCTVCDDPAEVSLIDGEAHDGAGHLSLHVPDDGRRGPGVDCVLRWAGPIDVPLEDEITVQAACGIMHVHGRKTGGPVPLGIDYASTMAGVLAAQGILAAILARHRGLPIRRVTTSVAQAALLAVSQYLAAATTDDDCGQPERPGGPPFASADGVRFEIETLTPAGWQRFWALLGADTAAVSLGWRPFQHRYATATSPLPDELHQATARTRFVTLVAAAAEAGISILRLRDVADRAAEFHVERMANGGAGPPPWRITAMPAHSRTPPPIPTTAQLPLAGVVVVEATNRLQGPLAGHVLWLLGARVIRIEPPGGDPLRGMPPMAGDCSARFLALNRGKQVIEIDLKSTTGRQALRELVAQAQVFVHNWAPGRAAQWELDAEHLAAVRPGLVYAYASGWGDALGPQPPLGTDFMVQAHSGLAAMVRPYGEPAAPSLMTLTDMLGGLVCAQAVLAGLLAQVRSGAGQRVDSSLLSAAAVLQEPVFVAVAASSAAGAHVGRPVWTPLHRPLATSDGYVALSTRTRAQPDRVAAACGVAQESGQLCSESLAARFRQDPSHMWIERLRGAGLYCVPVCTDLAALAADPRFAAALHNDGATFPHVPWEFSR